MFMLELDRDLAAHLAVALRSHRKGLVRLGQAEPDGLVQLERMAVALVNGGQQRDGSHLSPVTRDRARRLVKGAVARGEMLRPDVCEGCGRTDRTEAHHEDYTMPLEVRWLCRPCHRRADVALNEQDRDLKRHAAPVRDIPDRRLYSEPDDREYLTREDVARIAQTSTRTVDRWIRDDKLPSTRHGRTRRVARADLDDFLRKAA